MMSITSRLCALGIGLTAGAFLGAVLIQPATAAGDLVARQTPGAAVKDAFPNGCVDCHTATSKRGDTRISTLMTQWATAVAPPLLEKTKASGGDPAKIKGKHPIVPKPGASVPLGCLTVCHKKGSTIAPAFATLMHSVHLTGAQNQYVTLYQGDCTHCHKLDPKTGAWRLPSGAEK